MLIFRSNTKHSPVAMWRHTGARSGSINVKFENNRVAPSLLDSIQIVKEGKPSFFLHWTQCFTYPSPFSFLFPSSIVYSLLHNFIIFLPQCFYSLLHNFYYFPSSMSLFPPSQFYYFSSSFLNSLPLHNINLSSPFIILISLLHNFIFFPPPPPPPHLFYIFFYPQIHRPPIDPTWTLHRPHIDPISTPHRPHIDPTSTLHSTFLTQLHE